MFSPTGTSYQPPPCLGRPAMFDVAAAALAAERNVDKRYQLIGRVRSRRHRHPVIMSVHLQSSDVSTSGHFCATSNNNTVLLIDWLYCIDLFSCIAASVFNKLTYLLTYLKCRWIRCVYKAAHWHALACLAFNYSNVEITTTTDECLQTVSLIGRFSKRCPSGKELYFSISKMLKCRFWSCLYTTGHVLNQLNVTNITTNMFNVHNLQYAALSYTTDLSGL